MTEKKEAPKKPAAARTAVNKSAEVRKIAAAMKAKNEKPRPIKIIESLKKQGIEVSSPQVSIVLKRMGFRPRKRAKTGVARIGLHATTKARKGGLSIDDLLKAKQMAADFGGAERLVNALSALVELQ